MAIFGSSSVRLLREDWPTPTALAQELFTMFNSDSTIEITSPVQIRASTPEPPLQVINETSDSAAGIQVVGSQIIQGSSYVSGQQMGFTPSGTTNSTVGGQQFVPSTNPIYTLQGGQLTVTLSSSATSSSVNAQNTLTVSLKTNVFIGSIVSGAGQQYKVKLLGSSLPGGSTVDVLFPELDAVATLPVGSQVTVVGVQTATGADGSPFYTYYGTAPKSMVPQSMVGTIKSGSGQTYQVTILGTSTLGGKDISVKFPMVSTSETIPAGTPIVGIVPVQIATSASGTPPFEYYGSVSVWES